MISYERLIREHDRIETLCWRLRDAVRAEVPDQAVASEIIGELAVEIDDHLQHEDRAIYTTLIELQQHRELDVPIDLEAQFRVLSTDWKTYLTAWPAASLASDWPAFCRETIDMEGRIRERVRTETELIYPAALRTGSISLRDHRA